MEVIGTYAFAGSKNLTEITFQGGTELEKQAFYGCDNLEKAYLPESVVKIGDEAFGDCQYLTMYVRENSAALQYARSENIPFELY